MLLIATDKRQIVAFYREGYVRRACLPYDLNSADMTVHLTNQYVQKKHPTYSEIKEETVSSSVCDYLAASVYVRCIPIFMTHFLHEVWDFTRLQMYLSENEDLPSDWVASNLTVRVL